MRARELKILSTAKTPPFYIEDGINVREELRLKYRYLDLRGTVSRNRQAQQLFVETTTRCSDFALRADTRMPLR